MQLNSSFPCRSLALVAVALAALCSSASAQTFPTKTVRMIVAFAPGGAADFLARTVQQRLQAKYNQTVVVENKPGASATIAAEIVAQSAPDGHTILITNQLIVQAPNLITKLSYDPMKDLTPVAELGGAPLILAVNAAQTPSKTLAEFIAEVKKKPKTFSYASVGAASMGHLYGAQLNDIAGVDLLYVPYKGSAQVVMALVGGEVQSAFSDYATMKPHIESGKLRLLAVSRPYAPTPGLPTFAALGYAGLDSYSWIGMFVPAKTPSVVAQQLAADVAQITRLPEVSAKLAELGLESGGTTQERFAAMVASDFTRWAEIMKKAGIKPE